MAVVSTYACLRWGVVANYPLTLIATAIVFPIVFSINSAYKRREAVLNDYVSMKAHGRAIYFATRDWLENSDADKQQKCRSLLGNLLRFSREMFHAPRAEMLDREEQVYECFSELSLFIREDLRHAGLASGEVSRCNQYLSMRKPNEDTHQFRFHLRTKRREMHSNYYGCPRFSSPQ